MSQAEQQPETVRVGDFLVDPATGEIVAAVPPTAGFRVNGTAEAEWVLEKILDAELEAEAVRRRRDVLNANLDAMERQAERRREALITRFGPELEEWTRSQLEGKKARSVRTPYGTVGFRKAGGRTEVVDHKAAAAILGVGHAAVKANPRVLVSELDPGARQVLRTQGLLTEEPAEDRFYVKAAT